VTKTEAIRLALVKLPGILSGRLADVNGIGADYRGRVANGLFALFQADFRVKSRGGTGIDGIKWPRLAPSTIARKSRPPENLYILAETADLFRSLTPGKNGMASGRKGQIIRFQASRGVLQVGTKEKPWHHRGAKNLPKRALWPARLNRSRYREAVKKIVRDALKIAVRRYVTEVASK
jgi:hypothetical protein